MMKSQHIIGLFVISLGFFNQHSISSASAAASERKTVSAPSDLNRLSCNAHGNVLYHYVSDVLQLADVELGEHQANEMLAELHAFSITLANFKAQQAEEAIEISWTTTAELNNDFFTIEKSTDGISFSEIGSIDGQGNSEALNDYSYIDLNPAWGRNYYRLKQTNFDGTKEYFDVEAVDFTDTQKKVKLTWANGVLRVGMNTLKSQLTTVALYTLSGQLINMYEASLKEGYNEIALETRPQVDQCIGVLVFRVVLDEHTVIKKVAIP